MHELSIASAILEITLQAADERPVRRIAVSVGHLRQVVPTSLRFAFELVARDTIAEGAELELHTVPATVECGRCSASSTCSRFPLACAACGSLGVRVTQGEELRVEWFECDDEASEGSATDDHPTLRGAYT